MVSNKGESEMFAQIWTFDSTMVVKRLSGEMSGVKQ